MLYCVRMNGFISSPVFPYECKNICDTTWFSFLILFFIFFPFFNRFCWTINCVSFIFLCFVAQFERRQLRQLQKIIYELYVKQRGRKRERERDRQCGREMGREIEREIWKIYKLIFNYKNSQNSLTNMSCCIAGISLFHIFVVFKCLKELFKYFRITLIISKEIIVIFFISYSRWNLHEIAFRWILLWSGLICSR